MDENSNPQIEFTSYLGENEKYALIGLSVNVAADVQSHQVSPSAWVLVGTGFEIPTHWKEWLGTIRAEELSGCNLYLLTKCLSEQPGVLNQEDIELRTSVHNFYSGLLLASRFAPAHEPVLLSGSLQIGEIGIRELQRLETPVPCPIARYPTIVDQDIRSAAEMGQTLDRLPSAQRPGFYWRLFRTIQIYLRTRTETDLLDRIHQFCRCIDGLILPEQGKTKQQFKSRSELFIGGQFHDLMGEIYDVAKRGRAFA